MAADKLEFLNSFFSQRLLAAAGEIFQAVKETIIEYQEEINRINLENHYLKITLSEQSGDNGANGLPMNQPNFSQEPLDTKPSILKVKVEVSTTLQQDAESQESSNGPPSSSFCSPSLVTIQNPESAYCFSEKNAFESKLENDAHKSQVAVKMEPVDYEFICTDEAPETQKEIDKNHHHLKGQSTSSQCLTSPAETLFQAQTDEQVVYCEFCGKPFGNREQLKQHLVTHKNERPRPYRCDLCEKSYSYAQVLETHRRTHTGERPYNCRVCGRRFNQKSHLKYHEKIHTGEKPHSCSICGKRFIQKSQMKKHTCNPWTVLSK